jgi:hypothetical protein
MPDAALKHIYLQAIPPTVRERAAPRLDSGMKLHAVMNLSDFLFVHRPHASPWRRADLDRPDR